MATPKQKIPEVRTVRLGAVWREDLEKIMEILERARVFYYDDRPTTEADEKKADVTLEDDDYTFRDLADVRDQVGNRTKELHIEFAPGEQDYISLHLRSGKAFLEAEGHALHSYATEINRILLWRSAAWVAWNVLLADLCIAAVAVPLAVLRPDLGRTVVNLAIAVVILAYGVIAFGGWLILPVRAVHLTRRGHPADGARRHWRTITTHIVAALVAGIVGALVQRAMGCP